MEIKHFKELGFTVVAEPKEYRVNYFIYEIEGYDSDNNILFHRKNSPTWPDPIEDIKNADIFLHGHVKWDGCSNWHFDIQDRVMIHACERDELLNIGIIMAACWEWTKELCDKFEGDI